MDILTTAEAGEVLGLSPKRVRELALRGQLPGRQVGRQWVFDRQDVIEFKGRDRPQGWRRGRPRARKVKPGVDPAGAKEK